MRAWGGAKRKETCSTALDCQQWWRSLEGRKAPYEVPFASDNGLLTSEGSTRKYRSCRAKNTPRGCPMPPTRPGWLAAARVAMMFAALWRSDA